MSSTLRILDANLNRAREALRVMEDAARFALNDESLCSGIKAIRHELRSAIECIPAGALEANRDSLGDVGAENTTSSEVDRKSLLDVVIAAGKRLTEAMRVIEELLKLDHPRAAERVKALRYRAYDVDALLQRRFGSGAAKQWKLCVLISESLCHRPWPDVVRESIRAGADAIQVREKGLESDALLKRVREVVDFAHPAGAAVIVNDRVDIALAAGADGVHLGQHDLSVNDVRRLAGRNLIVGVSTHNLREAQAAVEAGADYCGIGAMFASPLKPDRKPSGVSYLREFVGRFHSMPHLAIGGITLSNIAQVGEAGARGLAVSSAICGADDPGAVVRAMLDALPASTIPLAR